MLDLMEEQLILALGEVLVDLFHDMHLFGGSFGLGLFILTRKRNFSTILGLERNFRIGRHSESTQNKKCDYKGRRPVNTLGASIGCNW
jgi:hypothetical protein